MRLSREATAKSVIEVWQVLNNLPRPIRSNYKEMTRQEGAYTAMPKLDPNSLGHRIATMAHLGIIRRTLISNGGVGVGQVYDFEMLATKDEGIKAIARHFAKGGNLVKTMEDRPNGKAPDEIPAFFRRNDDTVAIRSDDKGQPVEAIVGSDAPSPFEALRALKKDEPSALVEAARQYANRMGFVDEQLTAIEKLGVKIDREKVMAGIQLERDDELEGIVKVLPFIEDIQSRAGQALSWKDDLVSTRNELRAAHTRIARLEADLRAQQQANERLATRMAQASVAGPHVLVGDRPSS